MKCLLWFVVLVAGVMNAPGQVVSYVGEDFRGTSAPDWTFVTSQGSGAALTGGVEDPDGDGWLRLTKDLHNQASFVYYNNTLPTDKGLVFTFDLVIWGSRSNLGDGLTLAIFDAAATPSAGGYGGSLGYSKRSGIEGLAGGIVGFGFDVFGNYSNPTEGREGGPGRVANSVAARGSMGEDRNSGYEYVTGTGSLVSFSTPSATGRDQATIHSVRITIPTDKILTLEWKEEGQSDWTVLIDQYPCQLDCPEAVRFGFTAGTGSLAANQEIRNLLVTSVPEPAGVFLLAVGLVGLVWIRWRERIPGVDISG